MDPDGELQRVGRPARSGAWIGVWALGLGAVVLVALLGSRSGPGPLPSTAQLAIVASASPSPTATPSPSPTPWEGILPFRGGLAPASRLLPTRPPLGEDGLVGGIVFGTNWPPD